MSLLAPAFRAFLPFRLAGIVACVGGWTMVAAPRVAKVCDVTSGRVADLVVLDGGFDAGLRSGMVARVMREGDQVGEIIVVDLRGTVATALILSLAPQQSIRPGDFTPVKVLKSQSS